MNPIVRKVMNKHIPEFSWNNKVCEESVEEPVELRKHSQNRQIPRFRQNPSILKVMAGKKLPVASDSHGISHPECLHLLRLFRLVRGILIVLHVLTFFDQYIELWGKLREDSI